ncbi:hypothetical protein R1flu_009576 [Riccia fluitans]|uniref:Mitochondrial transcription termination factor family protein n=1 Tax=Riccia fluitans TaxID=41844 RepID=A0ABD1Z521_9MARC
MYASVQTQAAPACLCQGYQNLKDPVFACRSKSFGQSSITDRSVYLGKSLISRYGGSAQQRSAKPSWMHHPGNVRTTTCKATDAVQNKVKFSREVLTAQQLEKWEEASKYLEGLGFEAEEVDKILGKAFGWVHSPFWSEEVQQTVPEAATVLTAMDLARGTGITDDQLVTILKKFPELLNCLDTIELNMGILNKEWGIKGNTLKNLIIRNPRVLGYNVDCKGDCMAKCTRCWVRF